MQYLASVFQYLRSVPRTVQVVFLAAFTCLVVSAPALATPSEGAEKVKEVTTKVSAEGVEIILAVLGGLIALIALTIVLPKAIGFIRRFI